MKLSFALFCLALGEAGSFAQLRAPQPGIARFSDGSLRVVRGVPANLIVDGPSLGKAAAASFSDSGGLIFENGRVELLSSRGAVIAEFESADPAPVLNVDGPLSSAIAWLPSQKTILSWSGDCFSVSKLGAAVLDGQVSAIRRTSEGTAKLLLMHSDGTVSQMTAALKTGSVLSEDSLPGLQGRTFFQHGWFVSLTPQGLSVDGPSHREFRLGDANALTDLRIERMSSDWLHIFSSRTGQSWALYLSARDMNLSWLPSAGVGQ